MCVDAPRMKLYIKITRTITKIISLVSQSSMRHIGQYILYKLYSIRSTTDTIVDSNTRLCTKVADRLQVANPVTGYPPMTGHFPTQHSLVKAKYAQFTVAPWTSKLKLKLNKTV